MTRAIHRARLERRGAVAALVLGIALACAGVALAGAAERFVLEPTEMRRETGFAWYVSLPPSWQAGADDVEHPQRSRAVVLEDGRPLGPAHAVHATIREQGRGAFSHWLDQVYFSSSDGSDPRSNGREYVIEIPDAPGDDRQSPAGGAAPAGASTTE